MCPLWSDLSETCDFWPEDRLWAAEGQRSLNWRRSALNGLFLKRLHGTAHGADDVTSQETRQRKNTSDEKTRWTIQRLFLRALWAKPGRLHRSTFSHQEKKTIPAPSKDLTPPPPPPLPAPKPPSSVFRSCIFRCVFAASECRHILQSWQRILQVFPLKSDSTNFSSCCFKPNKSSGLLV